MQEILSNSKNNLTEEQKIQLDNLVNQLPETNLKTTLKKEFENLFNLVEKRKDTEKFKEDVKKVIESIQKISEQQKEQSTEIIRETLEDNIKSISTNIKSISTNTNQIPKITVSTEFKKLDDSFNNANEKLKNIEETKVNQNELTTRKQSLFYTALRMYYITNRETGLNILNEYNNNTTNLVKSMKLVIKNSVNNQKSFNEFDSFMNNTSIKSISNIINLYKKTLEIMINNDEKIAVKEGDNFSSISIKNLANKTQQATTALQQQREQAKREEQERLAREEQTKREEHIEDSSANCYGRVKDDCCRYTHCGYVDNNRGKKICLPKASMKSGSKNFCHKKK